MSIEAAHKQSHNKETHIHKQYFEELSATDNTF